MMNEVGMSIEDVRTTKEAVAQILKQVKKIERVISSLDTLERVLTRDAIAPDVVRIVDARFKALGIGFERVFVQSSNLHAWLRQIKVDAEDIRAMATIGLLPTVDPSIRRYPSSSSSRYRASGVMFNLYGADDTSPAAIIGGEGFGQVIARI